MDYFEINLPLFHCFVFQVKAFMPPPIDWPFARERIPLIKVVCVVLFRFVNDALLRIFSSKFGIGKSTVIKYMQMIVHILVCQDMLYLWYVRRPVGDRLCDITNGFEMISTPSMIMGVIDGTQITPSKT